jgi:hypothetical protein
VYKHSKDNRYLFYYTFCDIIYSSKQRYGDLVMSMEQIDAGLAGDRVSRATWLQVLGVTGGLIGIGEVAAAVGNLVQRDYGMAAAYGSFAVATLLEANQCLTVGVAEAPPITDQV